MVIQWDSLCILAEMRLSVLPPLDASKPPFCFKFLKKKRKKLELGVLESVICLCAHCLVLWFQLFVRNVFEAQDTNFVFCICM